MYQEYFPDLTEDTKRRYAEEVSELMALEAWGERPSNRRTKAEQAARTTWRYLCRILSGTFVVFVLQSVASGDFRTAFALAALALLPGGFVDIVPDWYTRAVALMGGERNAE